MATSQTTVGQANRPVPAEPAMPAGPAVSRIDPSIIDNPVLLEVMEDNTWFNELEADPGQVNTSKQTAVRSQSKNSPSVSRLKSDRGTGKQSCITQETQQPVCLKSGKGLEGKPVYTHLSGQ